jgi:hypothetical protein
MTGHIDSTKLEPCAGCRKPLIIAFWTLSPIRCVDVLIGSTLMREFYQLPEIRVCEDCAARQPLSALIPKE